MSKVNVYINPKAPEAIQKLLRAAVQDESKFPGGPELYMEEVNFMSAAEFEAHIDDLSQKYPASNEAD